MEEIIIVGGGVAGLSCLNALVDLGYSPLLLEGATIGTPKLCGEFLAPGAVSHLQKWGVGPITPISRVNFYVGEKQLDIKFSSVSGAISRTAVEHQLATRAKNLGGRIRENAHLQRTIPATIDTPYRFHLLTGEVIEAKTAFFATGKYGNDTQPSIIPTPYHGIKFHFHHLEKSDSLQMFSLNQTYLGLVAISDEISNCACLIKREAVMGDHSPADYFYKLISSHPILKHQFSSVDMSSITLLSGSAPAFYRKHPPSWPHSYWIGDAFASLYPAIGSGFAHSVESAIQSVHYFLQRQPEAYRKNYGESLRAKLVLGKLFNTILLHPKFGQYVISILRSPRIVNLILKKLDYL